MPSAALRLEVLGAQPDDELAWTLVRCGELSAENEEWCAAGAAFGESEELRAKVARLERQLDEGRRAAKRQAASASREGSEDGAAPVGSSS